MRIWLAIHNSATACQDLIPSELQVASGLIQSTLAAPVRLVSLAKLTRLVVKMGHQFHGNRGSMMGHGHGRADHWSAGLDVFSTDSLVLTSNASLVIMQGKSHNSYTTPYIVLHQEIPEQVSDLTWFAPTGILTTKEKASHATPQIPFPTTCIYGVVWWPSRPLNRY